MSSSLVIALTTSMVLGVVNLSYGQAVRSCGPPQREDSSTTSTSSGNTQVPKPSSRVGEWAFIPSLCVSQRYDSNVFFSGSGNHDYVTHVAPKVLVRHIGDYVSGTLEVTGFNETYVRNSNLNFFGGASALSLSFDKTIQRLLPNASFLITESIRYSPLPPSFVNPLAGTSPNDPINPQDAFARGIIAFRTNNFSNGAGANFSYRVSPMVSVNLAYSNAITRFLKSELTQSLGIPLLDITIHTGTAGSAFRITESDTLNARYSFSSSSFSSATTVTTGGAVSTDINQSFQSHTASLGWAKIWAPYLRSELGGGGISINSEIGTGLTSWAMDASLTFTDPKYPVTLAFSRSAFPSILVQATPVIGNTVSLSAIQRLSQDWQLTESLNFSQSTGATSANNSGANRLRFTTYRAAIDLYYWVTRVWATALSYDYMRFDTEFGGLSSNFDRHTMTLGVKATWE